MKLIKRMGGLLLCFSLAISAVPLMEVHAAEENKVSAGAEKTSDAGVSAAEESQIPKIVISVGKGQKTPEFTEESAGQSMELLIENQGSALAKNVKVTPVISDASAWPFEIADMNYERGMGDMEAGGKVTAKWEDLKVRSGVGTNNYRLEFLITCDDGSQTYSASKFVFVKTIEKEKPAPEAAPEPEQSGEVFNNEPIMTSGDGGTSDKSTVPRVIVTGFNTEPGEVNAGNNFRLIVHLKNTSGRTAVSNMLFDFQAPSSGTEGAAEAPAFLPSSGSSTVYLDRIDAGGTKDIVIDLNARADLVQKPYSIAMSMKYEDGDAAQYEAASSLAIPVKQAARFEFSEFEIAPEEVAVGEEASVTCSLYNTGRVKLYNVKAKFEGKGIEAKEVFIGNLDSGATGAIDGIITAVKESTPDQKFKMIVSYEDNAGQAAKVEKEFTLQVVPPQENMDMTAATMVPEQKSLPIVPIVIAVVVLLGVVILIVVLKKRKKKRESVEEEDLLDEVDRFTEDE